jgi:hypothetical protein
MPAPVLPISVKSYCRLEYSLKLIVGLQTIDDYLQDYHNHAVYSNISVLSILEFFMEFFQAHRSLASVTLYAYSGGSDSAVCFHA